MNRRKTTELFKKNKGTFIGIYSGSSFFTIRQLLMDGILTRCEEVGLFPLVEVVSDENKPPRSLAQGVVSAAIVFGSEIADQNLHLKYDVPVLYVNTNLRRAPGTVTFDERHGIELAVLHLMEKGRKRLAYIFCEREHYSADARLRGIVDSCEHHNLTHPAVLKFDRELTLGVSSNQMLQVLDSFCSTNKHIDGIILSPDRIAPLCYKILAAKKRRVPEDVSIVGFNNDILTRLISPRLSALWPHYEKLGKDIVDIILDRLSGGDRMSEPIVVPYDLIERESS